jgi:hypothetical protein
LDARISRGGRPPRRLPAQITVRFPDCAPPSIGAHFGGLVA